VNKPQAPSIVLWLWQHLPWTGLYWLSIAGLLGAAVSFGVLLELRDFRLRHTELADLEIKDGDMIKVAVILNGDEVLVEKNGRRADVRMLGIHAFDPVVNEFEITAFGRASVGFLERWALNKEVTIVFDHPIKDSHGRYLGYLERDGVDLNQRMVEEGIAMAYTEYDFAREASYLSTELLARQAARGIWGSPKTKTRTLALRKNWAGARFERTGMASLDPLLAVKP
jgi:endonuclease YncB( thermonuclease family)